MSTDLTATSTQPRGRGTARVSVVRVLPIGGRRPATTMLETAELLIGREGHVAGPLALGDAEASRQHAAIVREDDGWLVADRGSRNGTFVDGVRIERAPLRDGSVIRVGKTLLLYVDAEVRSTDGAPP